MRRTTSNDSWPPQPRALPPTTPPLPPPLSSAARRALPAWHGRVDFSPQHGKPLLTRSQPTNPVMLAPCNTLAFPSRLALRLPPMAGPATVQPRMRIHSLMQLSLQPAVMLPQSHRVFDHQACRGTPFVRLPCHLGRGWASVRASLRTPLQPAGAGAPPVRHAAHALFLRCLSV